MGQKFSCGDLILTGLCYPCLAKARAGKKADYQPTMDLKDWNTHTYGHDFELDERIIALENLVKEQADILEKLIKSTKEYIT